MAGDWPSALPLPLSFFFLKRTTSSGRQPTGGLCERRGGAKGRERRTGILVVERGEGCLLALVGVGERVVGVLVVFLFHHRRPEPMVRACSVVSGGSEGEESGDGRTSCPASRHRPR